MSQYITEVCTDSIESVIAAQKGGADRVELCSGISEGGLTPSYGQLLTAKEYLGKTQLCMLLRPRRGDFFYSEAEMKVILQDIKTANKVGVDAFVFGCLTTNSDIDKVFISKVVDAAEGTPVVFHRAFDMCRDPFRVIDDIISSGCVRVLTSGLQQTAEQGIPLLKELVKRAGSDITIMPGGGINAGNISRIALETGAKEFHFSAREETESPMIFQNSSVSMGIALEDEYKLRKTSEDMVKRIIEALSRIE